MKHKPYRTLIYILARSLALLLYPIPLPISLKIGSLFGTMVYFILKKERDKTIRHLNMAFGGEKTEEEISRIAAGLFSHLGMNAVEWVSVPKIMRSSWFDAHVKAEGLGHIELARKRGKGTIVLASHFGNWELLSLYLNHIGCRGTIIVRRIYIDQFNDFFDKMRKSGGNDVLYRDESPKKVLKVLKNNGYIGLLADQDVEKVEGVFVDFFGRPAYTPVAPVKFAMKTGAALLPMFMIREKGGFRFVVEPAIALDDDISANTQRWTSVLEQYVRRYPDQWVWMHRRWKTRPPSISAQGMRLLDKKAREEFNIPAVTLMENAGSETASLAAEMLGPNEKMGGRVAVFCGKGNNGGDGLVAARLLKEEGVEVTAYILACPSELSGLGAINYDRLLKSGGNAVIINGREIFDKRPINGYDLIIDSIFGTGFQGAPSGLIAEIISAINSSGVPVLSVDIPSGLDATTGRCPGECVKATKTISFGLPKIGFYTEKGPEVTGRVIVKNIGFPEELLKNPPKNS